MMERCRIFAVCKAGGDGVAIHSKCGMLFSLLHKDLLFNSRQQGKASASLKRWPVAYDLGTKCPKVFLKGGSAAPAPVGLS